MPRIDHEYLFLVDFMVYQPTLPYSQHTVQVMDAGWWLRMPSRVYILNVDGMVWHFQAFQPSAVHRALHPRNYGVACSNSYISCIHAMWRMHMHIQMHLMVRFAFIRLIPFIMSEEEGTLSIPRQSSIKIMGSESLFDVHMNMSEKIKNYHLILLRSLLPFMSRHLPKISL